jgi:hypothetical protein
MAGIAMRMPMSDAWPVPQAATSQSTQAPHHARGIPAADATGATHGLRRSRIMGPFFRARCGLVVRSSTY